MKKVEKPYKRVGRPRFYWLNETMKQAFKANRAKKTLKKKDFSIRNKKHRGES